MKLYSLEEIIENAKINRSVSLRLQNSQVRYLPDSIGNLSHLTELWLSSNKLTHLPESVGGSISPLQI